MDIVERDRRRRTQQGAGAVEFLVAIPVLLGLILGILQVSLLYQARLQLEVATQDAARAGALHGGSIAAIREGLAEGLTPLYAHGQSLEALLKAHVKAEAAAHLAKIEILSPTLETLHDYKEYGRLPLNDKTGQQATPGGNWGWGIPESHLGYRKTSLGAESGLSIQDANLLKIKVTYHHPLIVAFVDRLFARLDFRNAGKGSVVGSDQGGQGAFQESQGTQGRLLQTFPLTAEATFRMQTPFTHLAGLQNASKLQTPQAGGKESYIPPSAGNGGTSGGQQGDLEPILPLDPGIPPYGVNIPPPPQYLCP
ncbi:TadE/TadG family type IV pilus assembly protein [Acidithiobacillus sp. M4-SHS-6]|uniref:TadE/TadG family type IV pilus assembly protein n=1 Tax=Acidithiobacillus sp. M4-SHS-6 TaxID=3383024 RepID=UPI0039BE22E8